MIKHDNRIADNIFYVVDDNNGFAIVANGIELYEFIGYCWNVKALSKIKNRSDAENLSDFLNRLFQFAQICKQKEIQKALGIFSETNVKELINESIDVHKIHDHPDAT